jgi:hypothetical protein
MPHHLRNHLTLYSSKVTVRVEGDGQPVELVYLGDFSVVLKLPNKLTTHPNALAEYISLGGVGYLESLKELTEVGAHAF